MKPSEISESGVLSQELAQKLRTPDRALHVAESGALVRCVSEWPEKRTSALVRMTDAVVDTIAEKVKGKETAAETAGVTAGAVSLFLAPTIIMSAGPALLVAGAVGGAALAAESVYASTNPNQLFPTYYSSWCFPHPLLSAFSYESVEGDPNCPGYDPEHTP